MNPDALLAMLGGNALGAIVKHLVPSQKVNKFIPLINTVGASAFFLAQGADPVTAVVSGAMTSLAAKGGRDVVLDNTPLGQVRVRPWYNREGEGQRL